MISSAVDEVLQLLKPSVPELQPSSKPSVPELQPSSSQVDEMESCGVELSMAIDMTSHITALGVDRAMEELLMSPLLRMDKIINTSIGITTTEVPPSSAPGEDPNSFTESNYDSWDGTMEDSTVSYTGTVHTVREVRTIRAVYTVRALVYSSRLIVLVSLLVSIVYLYICMHL